MTSSFIFLLMAGCDGVVFVGVGVWRDHDQLAFSAGLNGLSSLKVKIVSSSRFQTGKMNLLFTWRDTQDLANGDCVSSCELKITSRTLREVIKMAGWAEHFTSRFSKIQRVLHCHAKQLGEAAPL